jgi:hypothetical protein
MQYESPTLRSPTTPRGALRAIEEMELVNALCRLVEMLRAGRSINLQLLLLTPAIPMIDSRWAL